MSALSSPDIDKREQFVAARVQERHTDIPLFVGWLVPPIVVSLGGAFAFSEFRFPMPLIAAIAGVLIGVVIARFVTRKLPRWNAARRDRTAAEARRKFDDDFRAFVHDTEQFSSDVQEFRTAVATRRYDSYARHAKTLDRWRIGKRLAHDRFFVRPPISLSDATELLDRLIASVESDPDAVVACAPRILERIEFFKRRVDAGNIIDSYEVAKSIDSDLARLRRRRAFFNFESAVLEIEDEVQRYRDQLLSNPDCAALWKELQEKDERLEEIRRHNEDMEDKAEEQIELARERNDLLRQQRNAERIAAAATAATAWYGRKNAKATQEIAKKMNASQEQ